MIGTICPQCGNMARITDSEPVFKTLAAKEDHEKACKACDDVHDRSERLGIAPEDIEVIPEYQEAVESRLEAMRGGILKQELLCSTCGYDHMTLGPWILESHRGYGCLFAVKGLTGAVMRYTNTPSKEQLRDGKLAIKEHAEALGRSNRRTRHDNECSTDNDYIA